MRPTMWPCGSCTRTRGNASPALREAVPNICLQMLLRGRNTVGYTAYPDSVARAFVAEAANTGIDIFRIFDALNNIDAMRPAIDAVRDTGNGGCRSRAVLHRGPVEPERNPYTSTIT